MDDEIAMIYMGGGYLAGIPARDLTADEVEAHRDMLDEHMKNAPAPLYAPADKRRKKAEKATEPAPKADGG